LDWLLSFSGGDNNPGEYCPAIIPSSGRTEYCSLLFFLLELKPNPDTIDGDDKKNVFFSSLVLIESVKIFININLIK